MRRKPRTLDAICCAGCFQNFGLRTEAKKVGVQNGDAYPRCRSGNAILLDKELLSQVVTTFFVIGSMQPETVAMVYQWNESNDHDADFDPTLSGDYATLKQLLGITVFHYGPPLWRLGMTEHYYAFGEGGDAKDQALQEVVASGSTLCLSAGEQVFRVRLNLSADEHLTGPESFDPPPSTVRREHGRWDSPDRPALYVSDDLELCIHECRAAVSDNITVATLEVLQPLKVLDLSGDLASSAGTPFEDPNVFVRILSRARGEWYSIARGIAEAAAAQGYDGVRYESYYAQVKQQAGRNFALFGRPLAAGKLKVHSVNRLRLTDARYDYTLGPVIYLSTESRDALDRHMLRFGGSLEDPA